MCFPQYHIFLSLMSHNKVGDLPNDATETEEDDKWKWRVWFWEDTYPCNDQYLLQWEVPMLCELGKSVQNIVSKAGSLMAQVITNQNPPSHASVCARRMTYHHENRLLFHVPFYVSLT